MDLEIIIEKAKSLMYKEDERRKNLIYREFEKYERISSDMYQKLSDYNKHIYVSTHHSVPKKIVKWGSFNMEMVNTPGYIDGEFKGVPHVSLFNFSVYFVDEFKICKSPGLKKQDISYILMLLIRDHLCHFLCFDVANVIISFIQYDLTSNTVYGMYRKLMKLT